MHPKHEQAGFALPRGAARARWAGLLAAASVAFSGCGRSAASTDKPAAVQALPERGQQVAALPVDTDVNRPLTPGELARKHQLEAELAAERPTHRLKFRDGHMLDGWVISESPTTIRFRDGFGYSGYVIDSYHWGDVIAVEALPAASFELTPRDVRFSAEFPRYHFVKSPPYTIVTDQSYGEVQRTLGILTDLREQFRHHFAALIRRDDQLRDVDVVFFGSEDAFRAYARRVAPSFVNSAGFFSSGENRLALLNQLNTSRYFEARERLDDRRRQYHDSPDVAPQLAALRSDMTAEAKSINERLIRHEGAHQLFHAYHIHSRYGLEPTWLTEGLAQYCETPEIGRYHATLAERVTRARQAGELLPLETLLNHRDASGFFALGEGRVELAYAESWALVYMMMQDGQRAQFFDFVKSYRDISTYRQIMAVEHAEPETLLEAHLKLDRNTLESQWDSFITHL